MPLRRATTDTLCPGSRLSRTMASFWSVLQRRRRSWPSSSPPLSLLLVINIPVCLSLIVRGKRCPVFHGARSHRCLAYPVDSYIGTCPTRCRPLLAVQRTLLPVTHSKRSSCPSTSLIRLF